MQIRQACAADAGAIHELYHQAFATEEAALVATCATTLLAAEGTHCSLVAINDKMIVGHISFSALFSAASQQCVASILAPLAVHPQRQRAGIGSALIKQGFQMLGDMGIALVFVYGDPAYYGRFGFQQKAATGFTFPYPLQYPDGMQAVYLANHQSVSAQALTCVPALQQANLW